MNTYYCSIYKGCFGKKIIAPSRRKAIEHMKKYVKDILKCNVSYEKDFEAVLIENQTFGLEEGIYYE